MAASTIPSGQEEKQRNQGVHEYTNLAVAVLQTGDTDLLVMRTHGAVSIFIQIVVAGFALDTFKISAKPTLEAPDVSLYATAGAFTAPVGIIVGASGDLTTQAAGTTGWVLIDVRGLAEVTIKASSVNASGSTVDIYAGATYN